MARVLAALILAAALAQTAQATVITATASGYLIDSLPTDGTFDSLNNPLASRVEIFQSAFGGLARGVVEYDVQSLGPFAAPSDLASVELTLFPAGSSGLTSQLDVYGYEADGVLSLSDAAVAGEVLLASFTVAASAPELTLDVTSFAAPILVAGTATHLGFRIQLNDESLPAPIVLNVGNRDTVDPLHPVLTVTALPEPSSLALLGIAGLGWVGCAKRRRSRAISA